MFDTIVLPNPHEITGSWIPRVAAQVSGDEQYLNELLVK